MTSRRGMLAVVAVAAVAVAVAVALTTKKSPRVRPASAPAGSGVAVIEPAKGRIGSFLRVRTAPGGIAVGDGAVWLLDAENGTVSRLDPETGKVGSPIETDGDPSDIAAGEGALWVSNEGTSVSRIDAKTRKITGTEVLPGLTPSASPSLGFPRLSVGAGGVWMIDPNGSVIRLDARTGRRVATVATGGIPSTIAAGVEGVWFVSSQNDAVMRIDPATNRVAQTVPVNSEFLAGIAVGAGAVWVASTRDRLVWRISPGQHPIARAIHVGMRAQYVAFGAGSVWTGNAMDGTVSRIDPRTNRVTATITAGATQALAAGPEAAWVSVAAGTSDGALPATTCSEVASGGDRPDVLIASDLTLRGIDAADTPALVDTISFVLRRHGFRAGRYVVGYQSCDDATAQSDDFEPRSCAANASAYAHAEHLVAVIGPYESLCADAQIAILNRAPGGPLAMISPSASKSNLTRDGRGVDDTWGSARRSQVYYPTGVRNFLRLTARDDLDGTAQAMLAKQLGLRSVYLLSDPEFRGGAVWTGPFRRQASQLDVRIAGSEAYDGRGGDYRALAARVAHSRADGVFIGGSPWLGGDLLSALRSRLRSRVTIMAAEPFERVPDVLGFSGRAAHGLYVATGNLSPVALDPTPAGRRFTDDFGREAYARYALQTAEATEIVLHAIAHSDGTRASVLRQLRATHVTNGILGSFHFDRNGDITPANVTILRITGTTRPNPDLPSEFQGAILEGVETIRSSAPK